MRLALVANDASGSGTSTHDVAALLGRGGATVTVHPFDADSGGDDALGAAARAALASGAQRLVVAGGDGSIGPVAAVAAEAGPGVALAIVPTGTANDFARALEIPRELEAACALAASPQARVCAIDLLRAGERPFLNAASAGLSVLAARRARPLKARLGPLAYAVGALRAGFSARPLRCRVSVDGREMFAGAAWQVIVAGTGAFGGGSELQEADPQDGLIDVAVLAAGPRVALVRRAWGMRNGGLVDQPGVEHDQGREVTLELPDDTSFNVDGEVCRVVPLRFSSRAERVDVVCG